MTARLRHKHWRHRVASMAKRTARKIGKAPRKAETAPLVKRWGIQPVDIFRGLGIGVFVVITAMVAFSLMDKPLSTITIDAPFERVSALAVEARLKPNLSGGFLSTDLGHLREQVETLAWVDRVRIRRAWPDGLQITLTEQIAAARWGEHGLLNTRGELFVAQARHVPAELPRLSGPDGTEWQVSQRYLDYRRQLLAVGFDLSELVLDARGAWRARLSNGIGVRLGRSNPDARMARFVRDFSPLLEGSSERVQYVDMRYSNGFAVGWRKVAPVEQAPPAQTGSEADAAQG